MVYFLTIPLGIAVFFLAHELYERGRYLSQYAATDNRDAVAWAIAAVNIAILFTACMCSMLIGRWA